MCVLVRACLHVRAPLARARTSNAWAAWPRRRVALANAAARPAVRVQVRVVDAIKDNDKLGLSVRFKYCREARSRWVLVQDDDVWTSEESIRYMMLAKATYPGSLVGCCGRDWRGGGISYIAHTSDPGPARIILTIMMLADRSVCDAFFKYAPLMEDIAKHGRCAGAAPVPRARQLGGGGVPRRLV
jgi:hypothetical protein